MKTKFNANKKFKKNGSKLIYEFAESLQDVFIDKILNFAEYRLKDLKDGLFEHGFYYGEQQTKTYLTAALDDICGGDLMQEYPVDRSKNIHGASKEFGVGRLDYWCRYGSSTKISILIEVKQDWLRYYGDEKYTFYKRSKKFHEQAVSQIKRIKNKRDYSVDNLYSLALTLLPIFRRYDNNDEGSQIAIDEEHINKIGEEILRETDAHAYGHFIIPQNLCPIDLFELRGKPMYENHPGFIFLWSIFKHTRK